MKIIPVPCLTDNYAYLLICEQTHTAAVVDPSESAPVLEALKRANVELVAILCTHHHPDHVGGVEEIVAIKPVPVYGHASEIKRIPKLSKPLDDGSKFRVGQIEVRVVHVPAHTTGAIGFIADERAVFTGDTMFVAGCGRLFEGTAATMHHSLTTGFASLPDAVEVYPGHEYAEKNLRFAQSIEPSNRAVSDKLARVSEARSKQIACVPSTVGEEKATNPFLRVTEPAVIAFAATKGVTERDAVSVLAAVRSARDQY